MQWVPLGSVLGVSPHTLQLREDLGEETWLCIYTKHRSTWKIRKYKIRDQIFLTINKLRYSSDKAFDNKDEHLNKPN